MRVANYEMGDCVCRKESFKNNNDTVYGQWFGHPERYAVFSYGNHFPMYVWENGVWYGNSDKYSVTTSRHQGQCGSRIHNITWLDSDQMQVVARWGFVSLVKARLNVTD